MSRPAPGYKRIGIVLDAWKEGIFKRALAGALISFERSTITLGPGQAPQVLITIDIKDHDFESTQTRVMKICKTCQIDAHRSN